MIDEGLKRLIGWAVAVAAFFLVAGAVGTAISQSAQPGGIGPVNAFLCPLLGPWSQVLPPNPHPVSGWSQTYFAGVVLWTVALVACLVGSCLSRIDLLRWATAALSVILITLWMLAGMLRVIMQLA